MAKEATEVSVKVDVVGDEGNNILASKTELPDGSVPFSDSNAKAPDVVMDLLFDDEEMPTIDELKDVKPSDIISPEKKEDAATSQPKDDEKERDAEAVKVKADAEAKEKADAEPDAKKKADAETSDKDGDAKVADKAPPRGFVPIQALRESRDFESALKQELADLKQQIKASGVKPDTGQLKPEEKIKTLADKLDDLRKLKESAVEDPVATLQQTIDSVVDTLKDMHASVKDRDEKHEANNVYKDVVDRGFRQMETLVPGVFDESKDVNKNLSNFAVNNGLSNEFLETMTHPGTTILGPNGEARYLGNDAALFTLFLNNANGLAQAGNEDAMKEITEKIRADVEKELTKKFLLKTKGLDTDFKSIGDLPGDADSDVGSAFSADTILSEADFARLSEAKKEEYLKL